MCWKCILKSYFIVNVLKMYIKHILFSHCVKNIYYFTVSFFNLFISLILALKHSIVGFFKEYLLLFNFTIVTLIFALLRVKIVDCYHHQ